MQRNECEMEEMKKAKEYERAKAEADAIIKTEEENNLTDEMLDKSPVDEKEMDERVSQYLSSLQTNLSIDASLRVPLPSPTKQENEEHAHQQQPHIKQTRISSVKREPTVNEVSSVPPSWYMQQSSPARQRDVVEIIAEGMQTARMPPPMLSMFSGDPIEWPTWKTSFETVIEKRAISSNEKILYLLQYLSAKPRKIVEGYQFVSSPNAYEEAKRTLEKRFGHPSVVAEAFRRKLENWPRINPRDGTALREYADFLKTCELAMYTVEDLETLNKEHDNRKLLKTLPNWAHPKWGSRVKAYQSKHGENKFPPFVEFVKFVTDIAEVQCLPVLSGLEGSQPTDDNRHKFTRPRHNYRRNHGASALATNAGERQPSRQEASKSCKWCKAEEHELEFCHEFRKKPISIRKQFIIRRGLCFRCLEHGHMSKENKCSKKPKCRVCEQEHLTCLHMDRQSPSSATEKGNQGENASSNCTRVCNIEGQETGEDQSLIIPVWVSSCENPNIESLTYALIDCQSNATFITEKLQKELKIEGIDSHLSLSTMHAKDEMIKCQKVKGLVLKNLERDVRIPLPKLFTRESIPFKSSQIPKPEVAMQWSHLKGIAGNIMPYRADLEVGMLIGTNCPKAIKPREILPGSDNDPYGIRTDLGWGIVGRVCRSPPKEEDEHSTCAHRTVITEQVAPDKDETLPQGTRFAIESRFKEVFSPTQVLEMFEMDFHEKTETKGTLSLSVEDRKFIDIVKKGIHKREDGHYEMPLPLRSQNVELPNNRGQAFRRLLHLKARFKRDTRYYKDYNGFMEKVITDCAEKVPENTCEPKNDNGKLNYVAHHGVYHPKKKDKIRVVFDCSARYAGTSLNQNLLQGPDLTNNLVGVLCRFRQEPIAITCDVEGMFHQFYVDKEDRDLLRFLWWEDGNIDTNPIEYRMKVHLFGAASSPGCANFAFKKAADDGESEFGPEAADFIRRDFYVDDGLKSVKTADAAKSLIKNCQAICAKGGLRLHKFTSNSKEVIQAIAQEDRAKGLQDLDLRCDPLPIERTLGVMWCVETDSFQFRIVIQDHPLTRRGVLSTVSSVYDPLGFVSPLILVGKQILQSLCRESVDWDDPIPDELLPRWERWRRELHVLEQLRIQRCFKPNDFGEIKSTELHHFSDASQDGYGQCTYVRLTNERDQVHCSQMAMAKARVTPLKPVTIPRLELSAAVTSVMVSNSLKKEELDYSNVTEVFWTDSKVVLGYINNMAKRFHIFVANRIQQIHDLSEPDQWHYVKTDENPADAASRGLTALQLVNDSKWLKGPEFLWKSDIKDTLSQQEAEPLDQDDPELKKTLTTQVKETFPKCIESSRLDRFSDWVVAKKAIALCLRLKERLRAKTSQGDKSPKHEESNKVRIDELDKAEIEIIKCVQHEQFKEEIRSLLALKAHGEFKANQAARNRNQALKPSSGLYRLDPYLDENEILRVGGRLRRANMPEGVKHPVILPRQCHVTSLVVQFCHQAVKHQGSGMTHNELRQRGYWLIGGTSTVLTHIHRCTTCRKFRAPLQQQKMADLPEDRIEPSPPFTYSAVDYFGPFVIKEGRKEMKRYGVLFTCMASRAIHVETANTLETDSYINALRRFLAARGPVRQIRSDRGTNFVGARNELTEALKEINQDKISDHLLKQNCEWIHFKMNVPSASHMGGVWERQIGTVRNVLAGLLLEAGSQLDDESLRTLMKEAQYIVNSRPITAINVTSPDLPEPLTPNHLLTMKTKVLMPPPGAFQQADLYSRKRWRRVQHLANEFWIRWKREFLQTLQQRKKWTKPRRNLQVDDIVMIKDDNTPRNLWRLARVQETYSSDDGLVRKVKLAMATTNLDKNGRRLQEVQYLERPIQKLVLIQEVDREVPIEEPHTDKKKDREVPIEEPHTDKKKDREVPIEEPHTDKKKDREVPIEEPHTDK
ncbi:hypothetical protein QZH41_004783 [Actinostola sp. cb2023]|nr:hypothetical protein QZH41_004783 [Actinostola sp. cb2023]